MNKYAVILKNFSAFFMLMALLSLTLPVCEITVSDHGTTKLSGLDVVTVSIGAIKESAHHGIIADDYVLAEGLTLGMIVDGIQPLTQSNYLAHLILIMIILILPAGCCLFAMIATFRADKIKELTLPMILIGISVLEMTGLIALFSQSCYMIKQCVKLQPSTGIYISVTLCIIALIILFVLRMTDGFCRLNHKKRQGK